MSLYPDLSILSDLSIGFLTTFLIVMIAMVVLNIIGNWLMYKKAGQPGWAAIIPFYTDYVSFAAFWGEGFLFLVPIVLGLLSNIPFVGFACSLVVIAINLMTAYKTSTAFGKNVGFAIGLFIYPIRWIFTLMIATDNRTYYRGVPLDGSSWKDICRMLKISPDVLHKGAPDMQYDNSGTSFEKTESKKAEEPIDVETTEHSEETEEDTVFSDNNSDKE